MTDEELIDYYAGRIPVDNDLLAPLGLATWATIRLHSGVRDSLGLDFGSGLSDGPFDLTLGRAIKKLVAAADAAGDPWKSEVYEWSAEYGLPASRARDSVVHAIAYTAADGKQALMSTRRHGRDRLTVEGLHRVAGLLTLASVGLEQALERCRNED